MDELCRGIDGLCKKNNVEFINGFGSLKDKNTVMVDGKELTTENVIIATGSEASPLEGIPFDEERIISSTGALELKKIPESIVVIGGGVIGLEFANIYKRFGTKVTVIEYFDEVCPFLDKDIAKEYHRIMSQHGVKFMTGYKVV